MLHDLSLSKGKKHFDGFDEIQLSNPIYVLFYHMIKGSYVKEINWRQGSNRLQIPS